MVDDSRTNLYDYLYDVFYNVVTKNVYSISEPKELTEDDVKNGFIVIRVGNFNDESEFTRNAYGWARCYVDAYVPPISRGRLDYDKYREFEDGISAAIATAISESDNTYGIQEDSLLSADIGETSNANNQFFIFIKSFIVNIN